MDMNDKNVSVQNQEAQNGMAQNAAAQSAAARHTGNLKRNFGFFGPAAFVYAVFYAFCMFRNGSGITFPFFVAGSLLYFCLCLSKLEISLKKGSVFYMAGMALLSVSTFCTDDSRIISLNKTGIFLLMMSLLLKQFYDTSGWKLGKYLGSILQLIFCSIGELDRPFRDGAEYLRKKGKNNKIWFVLLGAAAAVPLLLLITALLSSADAVFGQMMKSLTDWIQPANVFNVTFRILFLFFASYLLLAYLCRHTISEEVKDKRKGEPVLAITVTGLLSLIYLLFCGVQIFGLFLGKMQLPEGYTYAEYAREGFFQLLVVSILNLVIVLFTLSFFRESALLRVILTVMSLCTFVMIASSAMRMILYIQSYDLTFLRILVLWTLAVLFLLFAGVIVGIFRERFGLFRYSVVVVTICYVLLSFSHPDYIIAKVNLKEASQNTEQIDFGYLSSLSADAAPVLVPYMKAAGREAYVDGLSERLSEGSLRTFNLSRFIAGKTLEKYGEDINFF